MKLKYTTKLFIVVNVILVALRTIQLAFLTEPDNAFLKPNYIVLNSIIGIFTVLTLGAMFTNAIQAVRQPEHINTTGIASTVTATLVGVLYIICGTVSYANNKPGGALVFMLALLTAAFCIILGTFPLLNKPFPKVGAIAFIAYWLAEFIVAYLFYTEKPLRVRTVYEIFAICFIILFSITFGKAISGINPEKHFRLIYPLGLTTGALCILSVVPEAIVTVFGLKDRVADSSVTPIALVAAAIFAIYFTINTFKKSNTIHPKRKLRMTQNKNSES